MAGKRISPAKAAALIARLEAGDSESRIAADLGVGRGTVRRYRQKLGADHAGLNTEPVGPSEPIDLATPGARAYIEGDDVAMDDALRTLGAKDQAYTMLTLVRARNAHQEIRSIDVAVVADLLRFSVEQSVGLFGDDPRLADLWTAVQLHLSASHPVLVDRMNRAGVNFQ